MQKLILFFSMLRCAGLMAQEDQKEVDLWIIYPAYVIAHNNNTIKGT